MSVNKFAVTQIVFVLVVLLLCSCAEFLPYRYQNIYSMTLPRVSTEKSFVDENIDIRFWIDDKRIHFELKNLADGSITINWSDAMYIHTDGVKHKLANKTSIFTASRSDPDPTVILAGGKLIDYMVPIENVKKLEEWTWYIYPLFNLKDKRALKSKGKSIGVDLPISVKGETKTYSFRFKVIGVVPSLQRSE